MSGLNKVLAKNIVEYRDANGPFRNRAKILAVPRLGEKTFEQAAGFLRINDGDNPLDRSSVHPEAYPVVERILASDTAAAIPMLRLPVLRAEWEAMKSAPPGRDFRAWRWINLIEWVRRSGVVFS